MCMPYLGKLFSGGQRRRNSATVTPRPSLAPTPQQSNATIQTANTTNTANMSLVKKDSIEPVNASFNALVPDGSLQDASGSIAGQPGISQSPQAAPLATVATAAIADTPKPASWWEYFGMSKNKKGSIQSL